MPPDPAVRVAHRVLVALALVATLTADTVLAAIPTRGPTLVSFVYLGLTLGQTAFVWAWVAMGRNSWLVRFVAALAATAMLAYPLSLKINPPFSECLGFLLTVAAAVVAPLVGLRLAGWRIAQLPASLEEHTTQAPWRYSLGALFGLTTAIALLAALARAAAFPSEFLMIALVYCATFAMAANLAFASYAASRGRWWIWPAVLMVNTAAGALVGRIESIPSGIACVILVETLYLFLLAYLLHLTGRRVQRWAGGYCRLNAPKRG